MKNQTTVVCMLYNAHFVKPNTNTAVLYAELGSCPLSFYIRKTLIKYWLKIINSMYVI